jgi:hypothetical protein
MTKKVYQFGDLNVNVNFSYYRENDRPSMTIVEADSQEVLFHASVNLPNIKIEENQMFIKNYSENEGVLDFLLSNNIVKKSGRTVYSGFTEIPVVDLI